MTGTFKLDHLHSIKPLLFHNFCNFYTFILGSHFLLPQRDNNGKNPTSKLNEKEGFQCQFQPIDDSYLLAYLSDLPTFDLCHSRNRQYQSLEAYHNVEKDEYCVEKRGTFHAFNRRCPSQSQYGRKRERAEKVKKGNAAVVAGRSGRFRRIAHLGRDDLKGPTRMGTVRADPMGGGGACARARRPRSGRRKMRA